ncbi:MAG: hypothetical protein IJF54_03725 [Clostridia bacterium]|nr:hypothetical protein [Clostridia bacterium]
MKVFVKVLEFAFLTLICLALLFISSPQKTVETVSATMPTQTLTTATSTVLTTTAMDTTVTTTTTVKTTPKPTTTTVPVNFTACDDIMFTTASVSARMGAYSHTSVMEKLDEATAVKRTGIGDNGWSRIVLRSGKAAYVPTKYLSENRKFPNGFSYKFDDMQVVNCVSDYTYSRMVIDLNELTEKYPDKLTVSTIGQSVDGREIYCALLGKSDAKNCIVVQGGMHGREHLNPYVIMKQLEYYLTYYDSGKYGNKTFKEIFESTAVYIIPMTNPDGITISQLGLSGIKNEDVKKNIKSIYESDKKLKYTTDSFNEYLRKWKANANGVDLNRNYKKGFGINAKRNTFSARDYRGSEPFSEPETKALVEFLSGLSHLKATLSYHSMGSVIYWECDQSGAYRKQCLEYVDLIESMTGYRPVGAGGIPYIGSFADHVISQGIPNVTLETGVYDTPLSKDEFLSIWSETENCIVATAKHFG